MLNKLTPEKFQKLSDDILNVGLDSTIILKGVILLIFEKALDEPKYSSMYAQLCKQLAEEAPNYDPPNSSNTFRRLLLNKCRDEFENRSRASDIFDSQDGPLTPEEEEQRQFAKRKMLGNIKFIGELGKLEMLHESILHRCTQQLLERRKRRGGVRDMAEDLECLCQIMKTCGRILDTEKAKSLMNQYFDRMATLAANYELPSRIRFMLQDVIELRENKWIPRKVATTEGPRTIQQIREEAARDVGVYIPPPNSQGPRMAGLISPIGGMPGFFPRAPKRQTGMDDVFGSLPMGAANLGTGPGVIPSTDKFNFESNGFQSGYHPRQPFMQGQQQFFQSRQIYNQQNYSNKQQQNNQQNQLQQNFSSAATKDLPPRFKKMIMAQQQNQGSLEEVSLRPSANSMILKPKTLSALPKSTLGSQGGNQSIIGTDTSLATLPQPVIPNQKLMPPLLQKEAPILIKQGSLDKSKGGRKDKGPNKEEVFKKIDGLFEEFLEKQSTNEALVAFKESRIPEKFLPDVLAYLIHSALDKSESDGELTSLLLSELKKDGQITSSSFLDGFQEVLEQMGELETDIPRVKSNVAGFAARSIAEDLASLAEVAEPLENGSYYPLFLLTLQQLHKIQGRLALIKTFNESKVNLLNMLPEIDRTKDRLAEILEDRSLSFLFPLLKIQSELWKQLQADPSPGQFYKWIKENLDSSHYTAPSFINALVTVLVTYITQESTLGEGVDATTIPDKSLQEKEKDLLEKFKPVLQAFLHDHISQQVIAVYALQVYCYSLQFPKGMLLRWFVNLYDLEVIEEEAFLKWKEDITDDYPGKGKALFQVNQWLTWLEEAESEEEEEEGEAEG